MAARLPVSGRSQPQTFARVKTRTDRRSPGSPPRLRSLDRNTQGQRRVRTGGVFVTFKVVHAEHEDPTQPNVSTSGHPPIEDR